MVAHVGPLRHHHRPARSSRPWCWRTPLIKRHMPRYNILLKDDKGYPFVRLDVKGRLPPASPDCPCRRGRGAVLRPLRRAARRPIWPSRRCAPRCTCPPAAENSPATSEGERPCLNFHMGKCDGFAAAPDGPDGEEYRRRIGDAVSLLDGKLRASPPPDGGDATRRRRALDF